MTTPQADAQQIASLARSFVVAEDAFDRQLVRDGFNETCLDRLWEARETALDRLRDALALPRPRSRPRKMDPPTEPRPKPKPRRRKEKPLKPPTLMLLPGAAPVRFGRHQPRPAPLNPKGTDR